MEKQQDLGLCLLCGEECNFFSQACGYCQRNLSMFGFHETRKKRSFEDNTTKSNKKKKIKLIFSSDSSDSSDLSGSSGSNGSNGSNGSEQKGTGDSFNSKGDGDDGNS